MTYRTAPIPMNANIPRMISPIVISSWFMFIPPRFNAALSQPFSYLLAFSFDEQMANLSSRVGASYTYALPGGNKSYAANTTIVSVSVPAGVYIASYTPGYVTSAGTIGISPSSGKAAYAHYDSGWPSGSLVNICEFSSAGTITLVALEAINMQAQHTDFSVIRIK